MQDLIENITVNTGISADKASQVLETVSNFIKEKYPLLASTVDSVFELKTLHTDDNDQAI